jgi:hypothetical protein
MNTLIPKKTGGNGSQYVVKDLDGLKKVQRLNKKNLGSMLSAAGLENWQRSWLPLISAAVLLEERDEFEM